MRAMRPWTLLGRLRWPARGGRNGVTGKGGSGGQSEHAAQRRALNWRQVQARLGPVRHRWDLAILCNLHETAGRRPADLLAAINSQAEAGRQLSPQVLSGRLRELEQNGYIRHQDLSVIPLNRVYFLQPPGQALLDDLSRITSRPPSCGAARLAAEPSARGL